MVRIKKVTHEGEYIHVRYRPPSQFAEIRTPQWASEAAGTTSKNAKVRMGQTKAGNWLIQSILIKRAGGKSKTDAMRLAGKIRRKINREK